MLASRRAVSVLGASGAFAAAASPVVELAQGADKGPGSPRQAANHNGPAGWSFGR
jgi:hypothetical protein